MTAGAKGHVHSHGRVHVCVLGVSESVLGVICCACKRTRVHLFCARVHTRTHAHMLPQLKLRSLSFIHRADMGVEPRYLM